MATIRELIDDKVNEVFCEYQRSHNITSGDIEPLDWARLEICKDELADHIQRICDKQPRAINYDDFTPSWYIYTDCDGEAHSEVFGQITDDQFFTKVSKKICFDDLDDSNVHKIFYKGKEVIYAGWQPGMKFEYKDLDGNTVWVGYFEHWDH
jgi:hypothetical protein